MPADALTYFALGKELENKIKGGRIDKITMPDKDTVLFSVRTDISLYIIISCSPSAPRCHITKQKYENPLTPPGFLMHLRKKLSGAVINEVSGRKDERVIFFHLTGGDELGYTKRYTLIAEIMGRYSNIILTDENGKITDCARKTGIDISTKRLLIPGITYALPPKADGKRDINTVNDFYKVMSEFSSGDLSGFLLKSLSGFAPSTIKEVLIRSNLPVFLTKPLSLDEIDKLWAVFNGLYLEYNPSALTVNGKAKDFMLFPYKSLDGPFIQFSSLSEAMEFYYHDKNTCGESSLEKNKLNTLFNAALKKTVKNIKVFGERISDSKDMENYRKFGEIITANIYRIKQGDSVLKADDYYDGGVISVTLDKEFSPQKNAQKYYKIYNKKKREFTLSSEMLQKSEQEKDYIESLIESLRQAESVSEINEIRREAEKAAVIRSDKKPSSKKQPLPSKPLEFKADGVTIKIGKNNVQNDLLVRSSKADFIWLHTQKIHGSHTVIESSSPSKEVLLKAASWCAWHSKAYLSDKVPVDYTQIRYIKKPSGSPPGKVFYTEFKTLFVTPENPQKE